MKTRLFIQLPGLALAVMLTFLVGSAGADDSKLLKGTWNVTLKFPVCSTECPCPGNTPNIPIPALHMFLKDGSYLEVPGGSPLRGPGLGAWDNLGHKQFDVHFKFFLFNPDNSRRGSEEVMSHITLTSPEAFTATATFDLFDTTGTKTTPAGGCPITETGVRFE